MNTNIDMAVTVAQAVAPYVQQIRQELHQIPETRYETGTTRGIIKREAYSMSGNYNGGLICDPIETKGGIIINIDARGAAFDRMPIRCLLFRADFDALPVEEKTGLPFSSKNPGKMHACGHDIHTAMLLGFLKCVAEGKVQPKHNLRLVFQDAEENPGTAPEPISGGEMLVREGVCDGVSAAYALHIWNNPQGKAGVFYSRPGGMLGNSGRIKFLIKSSGGHVMNPAGGVNALRVCQAIMNRLDSFVARNFHPTEPATLEPVILKSGQGSNVMPAEAELWFGFRTLLPRDQHIAMSKKVAIEAAVVAGSLGGLGAEVMPQLIYGHPALINHQKEYDTSKALLEQAGQSTAVMAPQLGGEDFAHYLYKVPGAMWMLGAYTPGMGDHHSPTFNPDESVFWRGALSWILLATQEEATN